MRLGHWFQIQIVFLINNAFQHFDWKIWLWISERCHSWDQIRFNCKPKKKNFMTAFFSEPNFIGFFPFTKNFITKYDRSEIQIVHTQRKEIKASFTNECNKILRKQNNDENYWRELYKTNRFILWHILPTPNHMFQCLSIRLCVWCLMSDWVKRNCKKRQCQQNDVCMSPTANSYKKATHCHWAIISIRTKNGKGKGQFETISFFFVFFFKNPINRSQLCTMCLLNLWFYPFKIVFWTDFWKLSLRTNRNTFMVHL